jgi:hypothetical protein
MKRPRARLNRVRALSLSSSLGAASRIHARHSPLTLNPAILFRTLHRVEIPHPESNSSPFAYFSSAFAIVASCMLEVPS